MKRTANIMNVKFNTLFYTALFSGLGVFSFLLLINYAAFPDKVTDRMKNVGNRIGKGGIIDQQQKREHTQS